MNHSEDCDECDGSGFVQVMDTEDCWDEDNCWCRKARTVDKLCIECQKVNQ